jgi:hypothetical protein
MQQPETTPQAPEMLMQTHGIALRGRATTSHGAEAPSQALALAMRDTETPPPARPSRRRLSPFRASAPSEQRLLAAQLACEAVLNDRELQASLAAYGYDAARLAEGKALRDQALALHQRQRAGYGEQFAATDAHSAAQAQAHAAYMRHLAVARVALREDRGAAQKLDLAARKRTQAGWLLQARQFYANALGEPAIVGKLAAFGVAREQLEAAEQLVAAVEAVLVARQSKQGQAQEATRARDAALSALNRWMRDFVAIARVALAEQPQLLERLGVAVGS